MTKLPWLHFLNNTIHSKLFKINDGGCFTHCLFSGKIKEEGRASRRSFCLDLHLTTQDYLATQINTHKIIIRHRDWMNVKSLKYDGLLLTLGTILEDIHFDRQQTLLTMTREEVHGQNVRNVGSLTINDRLLHYTWVHMLFPQGSNFSQLIHEDVFILWCLKSNVMIN